MGRPASQRRGRSAACALAVCLAASLAAEPAVGEGKVLTIAGSGAESAADGVGTYAGFSYPAGIAVRVAASGGEGMVIFVADKMNGRVRKIDSQRQLVTTLSTDGPLGTPTGLALDPAAGGGLYLTYNDKANSAGHAIHVDIDESPAPSTKKTFEVEGISECCQGRATVHNGNLYLAEENWHGIVKIDLSTNPLRVSQIAGDGGSGYKDGPTRIARFSGPEGLAVERKDPPRFIYVTDTGNHMLRRIDLLDTNVGVETIAGSPDGTAGCTDGVGTVAKLNSPIAATLHPSGERLLFLDKGGHTLRQYRIAAPNQGLVTTLAGTCGTAGWQDGSPLTAMFRSPQGLAVSPDGALAVISDTGNRRIRSFGVCDNVPCVFGSWRGNCDVTYMGRCVPCTRSINSTITKAAEPFNQDACQWACSVGHWQYDRGACTLGDRTCARCRPCSLKLPKNASFSTNGGFEDACQWACDEGFELNAAGDGCDFIPLSRCFESSLAESSSFCAGQNLTVKSCAPNSQAHVELVQEMADWLDAYYTRPNTCDEMLLKGIAAAQEELRMYIEEKASSGSTVLEIPHADIVPPTVVPIEPNNNTGLCGITHGLARQGEKGKPPPEERCRALCPLRAAIVEGVLGSCTKTQDCPAALNTTKALCCFALNELTELACQDYDTGTLGKYATKSRVAGLCNSKSDCLRLSAASPLARVGTLLVGWAACILAVMASHYFS